MTQPATTDEIAPNILRIRAGNVSPLTGTGSNCYLLRASSGAVLIDAGPASGGHIAAIGAALGGAPLAAILITHPHLDHSGGAGPLAAQTGAKIYGFGADGPQSGLNSESVDPAHMPDIKLKNGERLGLAGGEIEAIHTPGHTQGHLCFGFGDSLFSGDHVMGWASTLVAPPEGDMAAYRASLRLLQAMNYTRYFPGHGEVIDAPAARLNDLITHRNTREAQILAALAQGPASAQTIAAQVYTDTTPALLPAAAMNVLAHLIELAAARRVRSAGTPDCSTVFSPI